MEIVKFEDFDRMDTEKKKNLLRLYRDQNVPRLKIAEAWLLPKYNIDRLYFDHGLTRKRQAVPVPLTEADIDVLLATPNRKCPTGLRNYLMMVMMLDNGLRVSECINLKVADIDFTTGKFFIVKGKGNKDRVNYLSDVPVRRGKSNLEQFREFINIRTPAGAECLFTTLAGGRLSARYVHEFITRYAKKAGINKRVYPHLLRHTFATDLYRAKKNLLVVQKALGHANLKETQIYMHLVDDEIEDAIKTFR